MGPHQFAAILAALLLATPAARGDFTPLLPLPAPKVVASSTPHPSGDYRPTRLFDNNPATEFAADGHDKSPFVEVEFPTDVRLGAFRHVDRKDVATVAAAELTFLDAAGKVLGKVSVPHAAKRQAETFFVLPAPQTARRVRWQVTKLGDPRFATVGGAEMAFYAAGTPESFPTRDTLDARAVPFLERTPQGGRQPLRLTVRHLYAQPADAVLKVEGADPRPLSLKPGDTTVELTLPAATADAKILATLDVAGRPVARAEILRKPVRPLTVYILPHSHTDIGYTEIQTDIEKRQVQNLVDGMAHARRTANYPEGARFVWNVEVLWAADLYLHRLDDKQRADFLDAVKRGQVVLNGMYLNELTGLCRPEELIRLFRFATVLADRTGVPIDSVMISDVPGYTWGTVPAMAQAGLRYFSTAPNYFDRIGTILKEWENKPFWWLGPDGQTKVLVWIPFWGYAMSHRYGKMSPELVEDFYAGLEKRGYPYDVAHVRWSGHGDNAIPDPSICDFVKDWNAKYEYPRFIISGTGQAFRALEQKYGDRLPVARGDWTPYWEDGAGSSARETALNRHSSDRLAQAETLWALRRPAPYPAAAFEDAWTKVLLYSEHTWGAWCSVNGPERKETHEQWEIKKSYADDADRRSRELFAQSLRPGPSRGAAPAGSVDVFNTLSWPRTDLVLLPRERSAAGDRVTDDAGKPVPSQRLKSGELAFLAREVPPLAARRYTVSAGPAHVEGQASAAGTVLTNGALRVRVDEKTGGLAELTAAGLDGNFADTTGGENLGDYLYLPGDNLKDLRRVTAAKVTVGEPGPLVASLVFDSDAPGCKSLRREVRLVAGRDGVELLNRVDKAKLQAKSYMAKEGKESVNFAFPFRVPGGQVRLDLPLGLARAEQDLLPSACKNWFTVGRYADVSSKERGVTWVTLDAPLLQVGGLTATLLNSQGDPEVWRKTVEPTQKLYAWAMNNHWGTNYRAYQEGPVDFRFILRPHGPFDSAAASRFATGFSHPLLPLPAEGDKPAATPLLTVAPPDVLVTALKPSDDGKALIVRLFGASGHQQAVKLAWGGRTPRAVFLSDTSEKPKSPADGPIQVPGQGLVTLRVEFE